MTYIYGFYLYFPQTYPKRSYFFFSYLMQVKGLSRFLSFYVKLDKFLKYIKNCFSVNKLFILQQSLEVPARPAF